MKKRTHPAGRSLHPIIKAQIDRALRQARIDRIADPMRQLFAQLATGEALATPRGAIVMHMPEVDPEYDDGCDLCEVAPAIEGWVDCWARLAPDIRTSHMSQIARYLANSVAITPNLVEMARQEFEATVSRLATVSDAELRSAISTTRIAWEFEKLQPETPKCC